MKEPSAPANARTHTAAVDPPRPTTAAPETKDGGDADLELPPRPPLLLSEEQSDNLHEELRESSGDGEGYGDMRVAVLVPYSGPGLPLWFDAFADLAAASKDLVDWIIFCEEV